jgi:hypothetical protein
MMPSSSFSYGRLIYSIISFLPFSLSFYPYVYLALILLIYPIPSQLIILILILLFFWVTLYSLSLFATYIIILCVFFSVVVCWVVSCSQVNHVCMYPVHKPNCLSLSVCNTFFLQQIIILKASLHVLFFLLDIVHISECYILCVFWRAYSLYVWVTIWCVLYR